MKIRLCQILLLFSVILFGCSKQSGFKKIEVAGVNNPIIPINGTWKFTIDPPEKFWENEVDFNSWSDIQLPGECQMQGFAIKYDTPDAIKPV